MTQHFLTTESGAITVDWVVLTAALVGLGLATMGVVSQGVENTSGDINAELQRSDIIRTSFDTQMTLLDALTTLCGLGSNSCDPSESLASIIDKMAGSSDEDLAAFVDEYYNGSNNSEAYYQDRIATFAAVASGQDPENPDYSAFVNLPGTNWTTVELAEARITEWGGIDGYSTYLANEYDVQRETTEIYEAEIARRAAL